MCLHNPGCLASIECICAHVIGSQLRDSNVQLRDSSTLNTLPYPTVLISASESEVRLHLSSRMHSTNIRGSGSGSGSGILLASIVFVLS